MNQTSLKAQITFLNQQRWFQHKGETITRIELVDELNLPCAVVIGVFRIYFRDVKSALYLIPCSDTTSGFGEVNGEAFANAIFSLFEATGEVSAWEGDVVVENVIEPLRLDNSDVSFRDISGNSSNTILCRNEGRASQQIIKVMRRLLVGENVESSINRHLFTNTNFRASPRFRGSAIYRTHRAECYCIANLFDFQANEGSAWEWCQNWLASFIGDCIKAPSLISESAIIQRFERTHLFIEKMGRMLANLHMALSSGPSPFIGEPIEVGDARAFRETWNMQLERVLAVASHAHANTGADIVIAGLGCVEAIFDEAAECFSDLPLKIRQHGDFHLGQVLVDGDSCFIIDYEGEPLKSLNERTVLYPPFKDLAGMLRSFSYAAFAAFFDAKKRYEDILDCKILDVCKTWEKLACSSFYEGWHRRLKECSASFLPPDGSKTLDIVLRAFMLDKVLYELEYEINNRPSWLAIPINGVKEILETRI